MRCSCPIKRVTKWSMDSKTILTLRWRKTVSSGYLPRLRVLHLRTVKILVDISLERWLHRKRHYIITKCTMSISMLAWIGDHLVATNARVKTRIHKAQTVVLSNQIPTYTVTRWIRDSIKYTKLSSVSSRLQSTQVTAFKLRTDWRLELACLKAMWEESIRWLACRSLNQCDALKRVIHLRQSCRLCTGCRRLRLSSSTNTTLMKTVYFTTSVLMARSATGKILMQSARCKHSPVQSGTPATLKLS